MIQSLTTLGTAVLAAGVLGTDAAAEPIRFFSNAHYYDVASGSYTWPEAKIAAEAWGAADGRDTWQRSPTIMTSSC